MALQDLHHHRKAFLFNEANILAHVHKNKKKLPCRVVHENSNKGSINVDCNYSNIKLSANTHYK